MNKKGNIEIIFLSCFIITLIIVLSLIYILYVQINSVIYPIKQDLFYIAQNAYFSMSKDDLSYYMYNVNEITLRTKISDILKLNYPDKDIIVNSINYNKTNNRIDIDVLISMKDLILVGNTKINIKESIKLKAMEVK